MYFEVYKNLKTMFRTIRCFFSFFKATMHSNLRYLRVTFSQVAIVTDKEIRGSITEYPD